MKTIKLFTGLAIIAASSIQAQVSVNVNIGTPPPPVVVVEKPKVIIASPPEWGPVGYDNMQYYYLPDIQVYYDIRLAEFIYYGQNKWIRAKRLPSYCRNYDLYNGYKVVLTNYRGKTPYVYFNSHKVKYYKGYKGKPQKCRRDYNRNDRHNNHDHDHDRHDHHNNGNHNGHHKNDKHKGRD